jgi:hypothetical protein
MAACTQSWITRAATARRTLATATLLAAAAGGMILAVDASDFLPITLKNFQSDQKLGVPGRDWLLDTAMPGLAVVVQFTGLAQKLDEVRTEYIQHFARSRPPSPFWSLYKNQIEVVEQGRRYWLPIQDEVLPHLRAEVPPGQLFTAYVRYLGMSPRSRDRQYLLIDFTPEKKTPPARQSCFAAALLGVSLDRPLPATLQELTAKYGKPYLHEQGTRVYHLFAADPAARTQLIVAAAGAEYQSYVYSVQVTGPVNPRWDLHQGLRLGSSPAQVKRVLGRPASTQDTGSGYTRWNYPNSSCSIEIREGVLASMLITEDPNYFSE